MVLKVLVMKKTIEVNKFYIKLSIWVLAEADTRMEFEVKIKGREQGKTESLRLR